MADDPGSDAKGSVGVMSYDIYARVPVVLLTLMLSGLLALAKIANAEDSETARVRAAYDLCRSEIQDKRFDALRTKMPLYGETATPAMLLLDRKPMGNELPALKVLYDLHVRCAMRMHQATNLGVALESPLQVNRYAHEDISALSLLMNAPSSCYD